MCWALPSHASGDHAGGERLVIRGTARLDIRATRAGGKLLILGTLTDDTARPVAGATVTIAIARGSSTGPRMSPPHAAVDSCGEGRANAPVRDGDESESVGIATDERGRFCLRAALPVDRYVAIASSEPVGFIDGARLEVPVDLALRPLSIELDPEPRVISLDDDRVAFEAVATIDEEGAVIPAEGLSLVLSNEAGAILGRATTNAVGRARFSELAPRALGPPGRGELRVSFDGNAEVGPSQRAVAIERRAKVDLEIVGAEGGRLAPANPEEGVLLLVRARTRDGSLQGTGAVQAIVPLFSEGAGSTGALVGAAPLERGESQLVVTFTRDESFAAGVTEVPLRLRYVPDTPWLEPGHDRQVTLPLRGPSALRHVPLLLAGVGVVAWLALGRVRRLPRRAPPRPVRVEHVGEPRLDVEPVGGGAQGWRGLVLDAHDGIPLAGAEVRVELPHFQGLNVLARTTTGEDGSFELKEMPRREGARFVVTAPLHASLERPLPPPGRVTAMLVLRRRALLDRLVAWARRRGGLFEGAQQEPTPGDVRRAAGQAADVARWADAVERAAYGGATIDAEAEAEVDRLAPSPPKPEP